MVVDISSPLTINYSTFYGNNANTTLYVPKNSKTAYAAADYWKDFKAIKEFPDPDVNQDGYVDVVDVVDVARFVIGTPSESFDQFLADLNGSGEVNVADAVVLLNVVFDGQPADGVVIDNIHFVTAQGNDQLFSAIGISGDTPTSISGVRSNAAIYDGRIYNLNGQRLTKAQKGLYIINSRKVVVK